MNDVELARLEEQLERLLAAQPPPGLRARVARRVAGELGRQSIDWLTYGGLAAAALVLWANLSWSVSRNTTYIEPLPPSEATIAAQIRELLPELSEAEARRHAVLLQGAARLPNGNAIRRTAALGVTY
ncbi:MAG: hypothetical protein WD063_06500 [Pirellulales bacterium]